MDVIIVSIARIAVTITSNPASGPFEYSATGQNTLLKSHITACVEAIRTAISNANTNTSNTMKKGGATKSKVTGGACRSKYATGRIIK